MRNKSSIEKLQALDIGKSTPLQMIVWRVRTGVRNLLGGNDILGATNRPSRHVHHAYKRIDSLIADFFPRMVRTIPKSVALARVKDMVDELGYTIVDADEDRPWGGFYRMDIADAERFISEFFPDLTLDEARLGRNDVELSPKFLIVSPGQRLSWQYHHRRAERWRFLTDGQYYRSTTDEQGVPNSASVGTVVQFEAGERHRLATGNDESYTLVAEIWQHTDPAQASNEDDIVRLADDYNRS